MGTSSTSGIPSDILLSIYNLLATPELVACSRVCRIFNLVATPILYKVVPVDFRKDINPLVNKPEEIETRDWNIKGRISQNGGQRPDSKVAELETDKRLRLKQKLGCQAISTFDTTYLSSLQTSTRIHLPDRFIYTTRLTLSSHIHTICNDMPPLHMPFLHTLHITPDISEKQLNLCRCIHSTKNPGNLCTATPSCICPLILYLRPKRLIFGGGDSISSGPTGLSGSGLGLWDSD